METNESERVRPKKRPTIMTTTKTMKKQSRPSGSKEDKNNTIPLMTVEKYLHYLLSRK